MPTDFQAYVFLKQNDKIPRKPNARLSAVSQGRPAKYNRRS